MRQPQRRAIRDALPLLQQAERVTIVEACGPGEEHTSLARLDDVTRYLTRHHIKAGPKVMLAQFVAKVTVEVLFTPLTYRIVGTLKRAEHEDYYDVRTDFNPFTLKG